MELTEAHALAWLEKQATQFMENGEFTSDMLPGVTRFGCRVQVDDDSLVHAKMYDVFRPKSVEFFAVWNDVELNVTRYRGGLDITRREHSSHSATP